MLKIRSSNKLKELIAEALEQIFEKANFLGQYTAFIKPLDEVSLSLLPNYTLHWLL